MNNDSIKKIISFDFDGTLCVTKSGSKFCTSATDWKYWQPCVPEILKQYYDKEYRIVIFSNQLGIGKKKVKPEVIKGEFDNFQAAVGLPMDMFIATQEDGSRKPSTGMYDLFVEKACDGKEPNLSESIFVGDAAGRAANSGQIDGKKDFSCSDRKFAMNVGVPFKTPEEFFLNKPEAKYTMDGFDPQSLKEDAPLIQSTVKASSDKSSSSEKSTEIVRPDRQELVLLVGPPASGKSTFVRRYFLPCGKYEHVSRDILKDMKKCVSSADAALKAGRSVVIDNTSPKKADREPFIKLAKSNGNIPVRVLFFPFDIQLVQHTNAYRERLLGSSAPHVPLIALRMYFSKMEEPSLSEGIEEVLKINFVPKFENEREKKLFYQRS